jgi:heme/copper-type cytochrome/quinol oxidase subunit 2
MDAVFYRKVLLTPVCMIIFYLLLYILFRYLFQKIKKEEAPPVEDQKKYPKYDLWNAIAAYSFCTILFFCPVFKNVSSSICYKLVPMMP